MLTALGYEAQRAHGVCGRGARRICTGGPGGEQCGWQRGRAPATTTARSLPQQDAKENRSAHRDGGWSVGLHGRAVLLRQSPSLLLASHGPVPGLRT
jgi:hypothetical protein